MPAWTTLIHTNWPAQPASTRAIARPFDPRSGSSSGMTTWCCDTPSRAGTAIAALVPGYACELYDAGSYVQISLFPPADPAAISWTLVIAGSVKDADALPDDADVVELEALHDQLCEQLRPVWDAYRSSAWN